MITINKKDKIILKSKTKGGYAPTPFERKGVSSQSERGYAILELLFYISFFVLLSLVVINAMITMTQSFRESETQTALIRSGSIMERMSREIRQADSISLITASSLKLNTTDSAGDPKTIEFLLSGTNVQLLENNVLTGNLNSPNITVTGLNFTQITTVNGTAVKIILTVQSINDKYNRSVDFYNTVVLRGSY